MSLVRATDIANYEVMKLWSYEVMELWSYGVMVLSLFPNK